MKRTTLTALVALGIVAAAPVALSVGSANGVAPAIATADHATATTDPDNSGNPHLLTFDVDWHLVGGAAPTSLKSVLPAGWQDHFELTATATGGTGSPMSARCTYTGEQLNCVYENHGNDHADGMMILPKPGTTYTVMVAGVPTGWKVEATTIGTFPGAKGCPKHEGKGAKNNQNNGQGNNQNNGQGNGQNNGQNNGQGNAYGQSNGQGNAYGQNNGQGNGGGSPQTSARPDREKCVHTVVITQQAAAATTTTTAPAVTTTTVVKSMPVTGSDTTMAAALLALGLVGLGCGTVLLARRRPAVELGDHS